MVKYKQFCYYQEEIFLKVARAITEVGKLSLIYLEVQKVTGKKKRHAALTTREKRAIIRAA